MIFSFENRTRNRILLSCLVLFLVLGLACGSETSIARATPEAPPTESAAPNDVPTAAAIPTAEPTPTVQPTPTAVPPPTATPTPLTSAQIFELVSPSIVFIETNLGSGSGLLIHDGYIVTNAHVVWPYNQVRVVFPDGPEFLDVSVLASDQMSDLAVIGPLDIQSDFLVLRDGEDLQIGSELLLVGYPAESENFPQPTITRGILSRFRQWEALGMTYFQTDASITGGQSGGALISTKGEVIGVSGFRFSDVSFGLVGSASDVSTIVEKLILGEATSLGDRSLPHPGLRKGFTLDLLSLRDRRVFLIDEPVGTTVDLELNGRADGVFTLKGF